MIALGTKEKGNGLSAVIGIMALKRESDPINQG